MELESPYSLLSIKYEAMFKTATAERGNVDDIPMSRVLV